MKPYKKWLIAAGILFLLLLLLSIGANAWIDKRLPGLINRENDSDYAITYKDIDVGILSGTISMNAIQVKPKSGKNDDVKIGIYANVRSVEISHFSLWSLLFSDKIKASAIIITEPVVTLYQSKDKKEDFKNDVIKPFEERIAVSDINIVKGHLVFIQEDKSSLDAKNINVQVTGVGITEETLKAKIPFAYKSYAFNCDSLYYKTGPVYHISASKVNLTDKKLRIDNFNFLPDMGRQEYVKSLEDESDLYAIKAKTIRADTLAFGFKKERAFVDIPEFVIDGVKADIFRDKASPDDLSKKKLYNSLLRSLKFDLHIGEVKLLNSLIVYEERVSKEGPGVLTFSNFNMSAKNVNSGYGKTKLPDVKINVRTNFMKESTLNVDWSFNVLDKSDGFHIRGRLHDFQADKLNPFSKPYMNIKTQGKLEDVYFDFTGDDIKSHGEFALRYDDFKIKAFRKKDRDKENKLLSFFGNMIAKDDSKGELKIVEVAVKRNQSTSFYNFLWRNIEQGLKDILL